MCADRQSATTEIGSRLGMYARDGFGDRKCLERREDMLDEGAPTGTARTGCPVDAVEQLADRDDADRSVLVSDEGFECGGPFVVLPLDQEPGVDQDGQGLSGAGPASRRIRRRSAAKSSSTGGAEASSS
jgi:hypothetical protein